MSSSAEAEEEYAQTQFQLDTDRTGTQLDRSRGGVAPSSGQKQGCIYLHMQEETYAWGLIMELTAT